MIDILEGHILKYFNNSKDIITFKDFTFFYDYVIDDDDTNILRDCYIKLTTNGKLIIKKKWNWGVLSIL